MVEPIDRLRANQGQFTQYYQLCIVFPASPLLEQAIIFDFMMYFLTFVKSSIWGSERHFEEIVELFGSSEISYSNHRRLSTDVQLVAFDSWNAIVIKPIHYRRDLDH